ncbi:MAG: ATP-binding protein [Lachnospiraceae bacterium]|nr:ATP-binding protein [Lachnospiraceae bacterium]
MLLDESGKGIACGSAIYQRTADGVALVSATPSVIKLAGCGNMEFETIKKINVFDVVYPEDREKVRKAFNMAFDEGRYSECTFRRWHHAKGIYIWLYGSCMPLNNEDGKIYACCTFVDITKQKEIEEELAESRRIGRETAMNLNKLYNEEVIRLSTFYDNYTCIIRYNLNKNCVEFMEGETLSGLFKTGMSLDECYEKTEYLIRNEKAEETFLNIFDKEKMFSLFRAGKRTFTIEVPFSLDEKTGTLFVRFNITMKENPYTNDILVFVIEEDITTEVLTKTAYQNIASTEYISILCVDIVKNRYFCCSTSEPDMYMTGGRYGCNGEYSTTMRRIFYNIPGVVEDKRDEFLESLDSTVIKEKLSVSPEYVFYYSRTVEGIQRRYKISIRWLDKEHNLVIIAKKDVTDTVHEEQKKEKMLSDALEDAERANEAKTVFLSNMSHDMRTPLNGVIGFTNLAIESSSIEEKNEYLGKIKTSGEFLVQLINSTLDLSKIESHKMTLVYEYAEWNGILKSIVNSIQAEADKKGIQLIVDTSKCGYNGMVYVDSLRFKQIFLNLLSNAIKFTQEGGKVEFIIECLPVIMSGCNCKIIVRDNGSGMSSSFAEKAFEPYSQDVTRTVKRMEGTGLGLSIVKNLVKMMNGFIELESEENKGTQFTIYLPVKRAGEMPDKTEDTSKNSRERLAGKTVLLCEDHPVNTDLIKLILENSSINTVCAENGKEGLDIFASSDIWHFDAILMDICMPFMDGIEATKAIRKLDREDAGKVPVIAMTANVFHEDREKLFKAGMTGFLSKPVDVGRLFKTLEEQCSRHGQEE